MYHSIKKLRTFNRINIWIVQVFCVNFFSQIKILGNVKTFLRRFTELLRSCNSKVGVPQKHPLVGAVCSKDRRGVTPYTIFSTYKIFLILSPHILKPPLQFFIFTLSSRIQNPLPYINTPGGQRNLYLRVGV